MDTSVLEILEPLVKQFEGCRLEAYQDPNGHWTQGWGHRIPGPSSPVSQECADQWLAQDIAIAYTELLAVSTGLAVQTIQRRAAVTDFVYNLGVGIYRNSTLHSAVDVQDWPRASEQLALWIHAGGKVQAGLVKRRQAEIDLIDA